MPPESGKEQISSDHDLLIRMETMLADVKKGHENHLAHHKRHDLLMLSITLGSVFTTMLAILTAITAILWRGWIG